MPFNPRQLLWAFAALCIAVGLCLARADDADAVKQKLFQAKKEYDAEVQKFRKAVFDLLDKREDTARAAGDKKTVDQVKAERDAFTKDGSVPAMLPMPVRQQVTTARMNLDKAYTAAVKDYVRMKMDVAAEATEKEQQEFQLSAAIGFGNRTYLVTLKHYDIKSWNGWFTNNGTVAGKKDLKYKLNGELVPRSINIVPAEKDTAQVKYPLGGRWTAFRATVGVPKVEETAENPASALTFEVLGDGKSLWKSEPVTKMDEFQSCAVRIDKVKVLTLQVHAAGATHWARSIWFEPILVE